jgi:hypothetical protein
MTSSFSNVSSSIPSWNLSSNSEAYGYDDDGNLTGETTTYTGYGVVVALNQTFDADNNRTSLSATIDGTKDLTDTFGFNNLDQLTTESQNKSSGSGVHNVSQMAVTFG